MGYVGDLDTEVRGHTGLAFDDEPGLVHELRGVIRDEPCADTAVGADGVDQMVVPLRVTFTIDGDLAGPPEIKAIPSGPAGLAVAEAAVRAVQRCAPYPFLPKDKFDNWQVVNMNFTPPSSY